MIAIQDLSDIERLVLPLSDGEDQDDSVSKEDEIERLQVVAHEVASYESEVEDDPYHSWHFDWSLFIADVPGRSACYALLELDWDENWAAWTWSCQAAVKESPSREAAATAMLESYAKERLPGNAPGPYRDFLEGLLPREGIVIANQTVVKIFQTLRDFINGDVDLDGADFGAATALEDGEVIRLVSTNFDGSYLVSIFQVSSTVASDQFVATLQAEDGLILDYDGPWCSLENAELAFASQAEREGGD